MQGLDLGAMGIGYSSICSNAIVFSINFGLVWTKLGLTAKGLVLKCFCLQVLTSLMIHCELQT